MREHTKQPYKILTSSVGRHNYLRLLMYQCWFMVVVFHNILSQMLPRPYVGIYSGEKGHLFFCKNDGFLHEQNQLKHFLRFQYVTCQLYDIGTVWENLWIWYKKISLNIARLVIHVFRHWELLEIIYSQGIQQIIIIFGTDACGSEKVL